MFKERKNSKVLEKNRSEIFHTYVMKLMFLSKHGRPDIFTGVTFLSTRIKSVTEDNWNKLIKILSYLKFTLDKILTLEGVDNQVI